MITKYITQITASFNPLSRTRAHWIPRLLLSTLPASPEAGAAPIKIVTTILSQSTTQSGKVVVVFKDGKQLIFDGNAEGASSMPDKDGIVDLNKLNMNDVVEELDRHSRVLRRKEDISG